MTGPDHYREAEELLAQASREFLAPDGDPTTALAAAQVHATLAQAAASAHQAAAMATAHGLQSPALNDWAAATGPDERTRP